MLIYGDDNCPTHARPVIVPVLLALNVVGFLLQFAGGEPITMGASTVPYEITHGTDLRSPIAVKVGDEEGEINHYPAPLTPYLTLLTAMFLHGSLMHIIGNMLYLWVFGDQIEHCLGRLLFLVFYLVSGVVAAFSHIALQPDSVIPMLGASGAISGVLGGYFLMFPNNKVYMMTYAGRVVLPAWAALGLWFAFQFVGQFSSEGGVAFMAHIGGFVCGLALVSPGVSLRKFVQTQREASTKVKIVEPGPPSGADQAQA